MAKTIDLEVILTVQNLDQTNSWLYDQADYLVQKSVSIVGGLVNPHRDTAVVIVTQDEKYIEEALRSFLSKELHFIGVSGNKKEYKRFY